jgi:hypothetical protein
MTSFVFVAVGIAFLSGAVSAVFLMLVIGIRRGDRPRHPSASRNTALDGFTRTTLGASAWPANPVVHGDREDR